MKCQECDKPLDCDEELAANDGNHLCYRCRNQDEIYERHKDFLMFDRPCPAPQEPQEPKELK